MGVTANEGTPHREPHLESYAANLKKGDGALIMFFINPVFRVLGAVPFLAIHTCAPAAGARRIPVRVRRRAKIRRTGRWFTSGFT